MEIKTALLYFMSGMETKTILLILIFIVSGYFVFSLWRNLKAADDTPKRKHRPISKPLIFAMLVLFAFYYHEAKKKPQLTLASFIEEERKLNPVPYDFGDGTVMVNFHAEGNRIIFSFTQNQRSTDFDDLAFATSQKEIVIKQNANQTLCYGPDAPFFYEKNILFVYAYTFLDGKTVEIEISPRDCPFF